MTSEHNATLGRAPGGELPLNGAVPAVSVILPTYNRAPFLEQAFASIRAQSWSDWELIVVDDGSTDGTAAIVDAWQAQVHQPVKYVWRQNGGAYAARNTGLDHARGRYIAFFDSDDLWLNHYLESCIKSLEDNPDVDWIYAACRSVDSSGNEVQATTFHNDKGARPFLSLRTHAVGNLRVFDDHRVLALHLDQGLFCGLQNSVIRQGVFEGQRFWEDYRVVEDALFLARALARGRRLAYLTDVHVIYRIHDGNSSGSAAGVSRKNLLRIYEEHVRGVERVRDEVTLSRRERASLRRGLARHYFWHIGYVCCWEAGDWKGALAAYRTSLQLDPFHPSRWKTYVGAILKTVFGNSSAKV